MIQQFNSDTNYPGWHRPTASRFSHTRSTVSQSLLQMASCKSLAILTFDQPAMESSPQDFLLRLDNLSVNSAQNSERHFAYFYWFIIKDTNERPDKKVCSVRSGRVLGTSVFVELRCTTFSADSPTWKLLRISVFKSCY